MTISKDNKWILITLSRDTLGRIEDLAVKDQRSISNMCAKILTDYINSHIEKEESDTK